MNKLLTLLILISTFACTTSSNERKSSILLPSAAGKTGEMVLVMDSAQWEGPLGKSVRKVFNADIIELPRREKLFSVIHIDPRKLNSTLKGVSNLVFVTSFDKKTKGAKIVQRYFTQESVDKINANPKMFLFTAQDEFAKGQEVMYLFGRDEAELNENLLNNMDKIRNHFNQVEENRLKETLFKAGATGIEQTLLKEHQCFIDVPRSYQIADNVPGFIWLRKMESHVDKNVFIHYQPYTSEEQLKLDNIEALRESITKQYLFADPADADSYLTFQFEAPILKREINFFNRFGLELKGLWKSNDDRMGGPFLSYVFVDEKQNRLYFIEGFVYSPGKSQREYMREMRVILSTFKADYELNSKEK